MKMKIKITLYIIAIILICIALIGNFFSQKTIIQKVDDLRAEKHKNSNLFMNHQIITNANCKCARERVSGTLLFQ